MLQHEFEDLIGRKVEREEYIRANALYESVKLDKKDFCKEWDCIKDSKVVQEITVAAEIFHSSWARAKDTAAAAAHLILDAINEELEDGLVINEGLVIDKRHLNAARLLIGEKAVTKYRIEHDYELDERDRALIKELLA